MADAAAVSLRASFVAALASVGAVAHEAASFDDARALAAELIGGASVVSWEDAAEASRSSPDAARAAAIHDAPRGAAATAEFSLVLADAGIVDTGQLALVHGAGRSRAAAVLPPRQVALLPAAAIVQTVAEAFARLGLGGPDHPGYVVLVAGPSRTADIEQRMIVGAHGPRTLDVVVYG